MLFQDAVPGAGRACHSSGHPPLGPAGTAPSHRQHSSLSSAMARVLQLQVTLPLLGEMPTIRCTSPGSLNHRPSRALSGAESCPLAKCRPEARPVPARRAQLLPAGSHALASRQAPSPGQPWGPAPHLHLPDSWYPAAGRWHPPRFAVAGSLTAGGVRCRVVPGSPPPPGLSSASPIPAPGEHKRTFVTPREWWLAIARGGLRAPSPLLFPGCKIIAVLRASCTSVGFPPPRSPSSELKEDWDQHPGLTTARRDLILLFLSMYYISPLGVPTLCCPHGRSQQARPCSA